MRKRDEKEVIFIFDINGKLGSSVSPAVGGLHADEETESGLQFHCILQEHRCFVPATFEEFQETAGGREDAGKWTDGEGARHRIDFIGIPNLEGCDGQSTSGQGNGLGPRGKGRPSTHDGGSQDGNYSQQQRDDEMEKRSKGGFDRNEET